MPATGSRQTTHGDGTGVVPVERPPAAPGARRAFAISTGIATLFVFVQFLTAGEFVRAKGATAHGWTAIHGMTAMGVVIPAIVAALVAVIALRRTAPVLTVVAVCFVLASLAQLATGQLITTAGQDGWIPFHVFFSSVVLTLAIWASIRSAVLRRR